MLAALFTSMLLDVVESNQLRTILSNDAVIWCESRKSPTVSIQLFLSNRGLPDTPETFGYRHLLEHIAARSIPGHDQAVESQGGIFEASTSRDWMNFEWKVPVDKVSLAWRGITTLLGGFRISDEDIQRESAAIKHELMLLKQDSLYSTEAWTSLFGSNGISPAGDFSTISKATPAELKRIWAEITQSNRVVISVSGTADVTATTATAKGILMELKPGANARWNQRSVQGAYGHKDRVALPVASLETPSGVATLMLAFAVVGKLGQPFAIYTPSARTGAIVIGSYQPNESILDTIKNDDAASLFQYGQAYMRGWLLSKQSSASESAYFNGVLLTLSPALRPKKLGEMVDYASYSEFSRALNQLKAVAK
jgi:hypothetical protein